MTATAPGLAQARAFIDRAARLGLLIDGAWSCAPGAPMRDTCDPATGAVLSRIVDATARDVDQAVAAARRALTTGPWAQATGMQRSRLLWMIADLIEAHADELACLETLDNGKPLSMARFGDILGAAGQFRYFAGLAQRIEGTQIPTSIGYQPKDKRVFAYTRREPVGVVGAICPWNSPIVMAAMKLAPALAAGCTIVLKPSELTPLTALRLGELMLEAGVPPGVVNILTGDGSVVGSAMAAHPGIDKISFTGSTAVGRAIVDAAQGNFKRLTLELGGKSPVLVMDDADMAHAVPGIARGIFANSGQVCVAGSRIYVARSRYDEFVDAFARHAASLRLGHGLEPNTDLGPLISPAQAERVDARVQDGIRAGARLLCGGVRSGPNGAFYAPTVLTDARPDMAIMRDEIFGPVAVVSAFDTWDDAIAAANDTQYGLAASVWTQDLSLAERSTAAIRAGTIWVNCHSYFAADLPKGGRALSGWGVENGAQGLDAYLEWKTVCALT